MKEWSYSSTSKIWDVKFYIFIVQIVTKKSSNNKLHPVYYRIIIVKFIFSYTFPIYPTQLRFDPELIYFMKIRQESMQNQ